MEAKDTVIGQKDSDLIRCPNCHTEWVILYKSIREKQAEISFKAGIKEVVDWIKKNCDLENCDPATVTDEWEAKKKDWGI